MVNFSHWVKVTSKESRTHLCAPGIIENVKAPDDILSYSSHGALESLVA